MGKRLRNTILFLVLAALAAWAFIKINGLPSWKGIFSSQKVTIQNTPVSVKEIQSLAQLVTVSMYEELVVDSNASDNKTLDVPLLPNITLFNTEKKLVVIGKITTHVGIDMEKMSNQDITVVADSIHMVLPSAEVLDAIINPSDVTVFIEEGTWDNTAIVNLKKKIQFIAVSDAQSRGLLMQSESKARDILTNFFKAAGYKIVSIQFKTRQAVNSISQ